MRYPADIQDKSSFSEQELSEEQFLEQFAALEDSLALLQIHMRALSENVERFGSLETQMRRLTSPATPSAETGQRSGADMPAHKRLRNGEAQSRVKAVSMGFPVQLA
jgi:hypothetical protein